MNISITKSALFLWLFLVAIMLFFPTAFVSVKTVSLLLLLVVMLFIRICNHNIYIDKDILIAYFALMTAFSLSVVMGIINKTPGAIPISKVYILYPVIFAFIALGFDSIKQIERIHAWLILMAILLPLYQLWYLAYQLGVIPWFIGSPFSHSSVTVLSDENFIGFSLPNYSSELFLFPYLFLTFIETLKKEVENKKYILILGMGVLAQVLAGFFIARRIFYLVLVLLFIIVNKNILQLFKRIINLKAKLTLKKMFTLLLIVIFLAIATKLYYVKLSNMINVVFSLKSNAEVSTTGDRSIQFYTLLNYWLDSFIFGHGAGSFVPGFIRDPQMPWAYELYYIAMFMQTGLIGMLAFFSYLFCIIRKLFVISKNSYFNRVVPPYLYAMIIFLCAAFYDPYLGKIDYLWIIFFPLALINVYNKSIYLQR